MSNTIARRSSQKARTRATIREVAQQKFADSGFDAVTIADIAADAGVSVQTVFNHYSSKEEIFFADRARWVEGPAAAVRDRDPRVAPTTALREFSVNSVAEYVRAADDPQVRRMIDVLEATPALLAYERGLHEDAVTRLAAELRRALAPTSAVLPDITAAVWMAGVRSVVLSLRSGCPTTRSEDAVRSAAALTDRVLAEMEQSLFAAVAAEQPVAQAS